MVFPYLDNWLLVGQLQQQVVSAIQCLLRLLASLGICISENKSVLLPIQMINFIAVRLDSVAALAFLLKNHFAARSTLISHLCCKSAQQSTDASSSCGTWQAACAYVMPFTRLHLLCLQTWILLTYKLNGTTSTPELLFHQMFRCLLFDGPIHPRS